MPSTVSSETAQSQVQGGNQGSALETLLKQAGTGGTGQETAKQAAQQEPSGSPMGWSEGFHWVIDKIVDWGRTFVNMLPELVLAALVVMLFYLVGVIAQKIITNYLRPKTRTDAALRVTASATKIIVIAVGLFLGLSLLDMSGTVTSLLAGAGVLGLALGLAFQDVAENFLIGFLMSIRKPFDVGDLIKSCGHLGYVQDVNLRNTVLEDFQGQSVIIPNSEVYKTPIINYEATGYRKLEFRPRPTWDQDIEKFENVTREALQPLPFVQNESSVECYVLDYEAHYLDALVRIQIQYPGTDFFAAKHQAMQAMQKAYRENGITLAYPIRTLKTQPAHGDADPLLQDAFSANGSREDAGHE
ncbi:MAG: small-conductance mechanosensitive channel [Puniceicoccaceae bacterium 5H]|nr:MAG: small-conductance mechanosensitive channel [Puniceicoccaceae bacterium 5H]